jgi:hypothetical protein
MPFMLKRRVPLDLEAIAKRHADAGPDEWTAETKGVYAQGKVIMAADCGDPIRASDHAKARFIAHAKQDIPALLNEVHGLRSGWATATQQATTCARCLVFKHTPWRDDEDGYICAGCMGAENERLRAALEACRTEIKNEVVRNGLTGGLPGDPTDTLWRALLARVEAGLSRAPKGEAGDAP